MKKSRFFAAAFAATMCATSVLGLAACSKEAESDGSSDLPVTPAVYTVTYNANGGTFGSGVATTATTVDGKLTSLLTSAQVTYAGHTFGGWYSEQTGGTAVTVNTVFTENKTIWAHWTPVQTDPTPGGSTFTITFDTQGGTLDGGAAATATTDTDGKLATYPTATGTTEFLGWALEEESDEYLDANHVFTDNTTIYAQWAEEQTGSTYTITFNTMGGTLDGGAAATATTGTDGKLATYPTATGTTEFLGWALEDISDEYLDANHVFTSDTTIYAQWGVEEGPGGGNITFTYNYSAALVFASGETIVISFNATLPSWADTTTPMIHMWDESGFSQDFSLNKTTYNVEANLSDISFIIAFFQTDSASENVSWKKTDNQAGTGFANGNEYVYAPQDPTWTENWVYGEDGVFTYNKTSAPITRSTTPPRA